MSKPALGRGLGALLGGTTPGVRPLQPAGVFQPPPSSEATAVGADEHVLRVPLDRLRACRFQPRKDFTPEALKELADSIREQGIVQPLIVRRVGEYWELIAGERRWRAAQLAGLTEAPVIVREADDRAVLELALIENLQRENLNPIEEAQGYSQLIEQFQLRQEEVAVKVGKSRAVVANALRLLKLPATVQSCIRDARLSVGHAKVILGLSTEKLQSQATGRVLKESLNVRQTEQLVARLQSRAAAPATAGAVVNLPLGRDAHIAELENRIRECVGTKVTVRYNKGRGAVEITFFSDDELERILQILGVSTS